MNATVFSSSGGVTCEPFPPLRGFGILSEMSHPKSYTEIVGGSICRRRLSRAWAAWVCGMLIARSVGGRYATFFLGHIHLQEETVKRVSTFKYLRSTLLEDGEQDGEVIHRVQNGWNNRKSMCGVLDDETEREDPKGGCTGHW